jgi:hypothetical protein
MKFVSELVAVALLAVAVPASIAAAQNSQNPPAQTADAGDQFKAGADQLGNGFDKIGEGFKQGAIQAWEAVKAGAHAAGDKLNGHSSSPPAHASKPPPAQPGASVNSGPAPYAPAPYAEEPATH